MLWTCLPSISITELLTYITIFEKFIPSFKSNSYNYQFLVWYNTDINKILKLNLKNGRIQEIQHA